MDPSKDEVEIERCYSPLFHSTHKTNNHKIKNKLAYFTASESKNVKYLSIHFFNFSYCYLDHSPR